MSEKIALYRDCMAMMIPSGARIKLHAGTEITIVQALGDTFTVNVYGNLARIEGKDADALGKPVKSALQALPEEASIEDKVWAQLKMVYDPEIPVNIVDLGLVYECKIECNDDQHQVNIQMTLTAPGCGMGPVIAEDARQKILQIETVTEVRVDLVFDPPWDRSMMSVAAQLELGVFD